MRLITLTALSLLVAVTAFAITPPLANPVPVAGPEYGQPASDQWHPAVTRVGTVPVTAWVDDSGEVSTVRLSRLGGTPLTVGEARINPTDPFDEYTANWLDVFYDGVTVWVVWFGEDRQLGIRRYTRDLVPIDAAPRMFAAPEEADRVLAGAAGDGALTVIFHRLVDIDTHGTMPRHTELVANVFRVDSEAIAKVSELELKSDTDQVEGAGAAWDGQFFFVAWRQMSVSIADPPLPYPTRIRALHITPNGERVEPGPLQLYYGEDYLHDLFVEALPDGILLAWSQVDGVRLARYPSDVMPLRPVLLPLPYSGQRRLGAIAPLFTGEVDVYWWTSDHRFHKTIRYERLSPSLQSTGDVHVTPLFEGKARWMQLDAIAIGTLPVVVHTQLERNPALGDMTRLFARQGQTRRRAVR